MSLLQRVWWVLRGGLVLLNNLYCIPTYVVWMVLLQPLKLVSEDMYCAVEGTFFHWLLTMVAFWSHSAHYRIVETGDWIEDVVGSETLVMVNHQSTSDVPLLMAAFAARPSILPRLNWIMDAVFKYTNFGIVSAIHGDFFINAGRDRREASIKELVSYLKKEWIPKKRNWLVLFPEGGFLRKRKETSNRYSSKMGLPILEHVTLPRMGALQAIIDTVGPRVKKLASREQHRELSVTNGKIVIEPGHPDRQLNAQPTYQVVYGSKPSELKWIVDMTIAYPNGTPLDLVAIVTGCSPPCHVHFHYKIYPIHQVPTLDKKDLQDWVYTRYLAKEDMLRRFYETGEWIEGIEDGVRFVEQDLLRVFILHLFFILSTLTQIVLVYKFASLFHYGDLPN